MPKRKTQRVRTTTDMIVQHSKKHLEKNSHLKLWIHLPSLSQILSPLIFAFAGVAVMLSAFYILNSVDIESPVIIAENATNYASQQAFYSEEVEELHAVASEFDTAKFKIREAAIAVELSKEFNFIALFLVLAGIWYLHKRHGAFSKNRAGFMVRKIR
jgi:hypothetical protein